MPFIAKVQTTDLNRDGWPDIVVLNGVNDAGADLSLFTQQSGAFIESPLSLRSQACSTGPRLNVTFGDFNGDSRSDMAIACRPSRVEVLMATTTGTYNSVEFSMGGSAITSVAAGDLNNDGFDDIVAADFADFPDGGNPGRTFFRYGQSDGGFTPLSSVATDGQGVAVAIADLNLDGLKDVVVSYSKSQSNQVQILRGLGDGGYIVSAHSTAPATPSAFALADFNRDGFPDLATGSNNNNSGSTVAVLMGSDAGFGVSRVENAGQLPWDVAAGDLNGDGHADLAVACRVVNGPGGLFLLAGQGDGGFRPAVLFDGGSAELDSIAIADLNRDGASDLIIKANGTIRIVQSGIIGTACGVIR